MARNGDKVTVFVEALIETGTNHLMRSLDIEASKAHEAMKSITQSLCWQFARTVLYVPASLGGESSRGTDIFAAYQIDGPNGVKAYSGERVEQLAQEFNVTTHWVYKVLRKYRARAAFLPQSVCAESATDAEKKG